MNRKRMTALVGIGGAAALTAVSASISTPVCPAQEADAVISTERRASSSVREMSIPSIRTGWHIGMMSGVCFAAIMPATCATARTSPFFMPPFLMSAKVFSLTVTRPAATAVRTVAGLSPTSTIFALP